MAFILPLVYCIACGYAWALVFKKKFYDSLAPALFFQTIIVLLAGIILHKLSAGLMAGAVIMAATLIFALLRQAGNVKRGTSAGSKTGVRSGKALLRNASTGLLVFLVFYILCFVLNSGKTFLYWDEFSHWGMFLKESLRLDDLHCTSSLNFAHKDYLPGVTVFEYIYLKLSGGFSEAGAYRAIQVLMFSMLLPITGRASETVLWKTTGKVYSDTKKRKNIRGGVTAALTVLMIPMLFNSLDAFLFYHSIYKDIILGIMLFYCMMTAFENYKDRLYQMLVLTLGLTIFALTKMTAVALIPMVMVFFVIKTLAFEKQRDKKYDALVLLPLAVPYLVWFACEGVIKKYVISDGNIQSYGSMNLSAIKEVFRPEVGSVADNIGKTFRDALFHWDVFLKASYVTVLIAAVAVVLIMSIFIKDKNLRGRVLLTDLWIGVAGITYALFMHFMYLTQFNQDEALRMASYRRYMNTFMIAVFFLILFMCIEAGIWSRYKKVYFAVTAALIVGICFNASVLTQLLPGNVAGDTKSERLAVARNDALLIKENTPENSSIYILSRTFDAADKVRAAFYVEPRYVDGDSIGTPVDENDTYSVDMTVEEFTDMIGNYDYLYIKTVDQAFIDEYSSAFTDPSLIGENTLYKVSTTGGQISLKAI